MPRICGGEAGSSAIAPRLSSQRLVYRIAVLTNTVCVMPERSTKRRFAEIPSGFVQAHGPNSGLNANGRVDPATITVDPNCEVSAGCGNVTDGPPMFDPSVRRTVADDIVTVCDAAMMMLNFAVRCGPPVTFDWYMNGGAGVTMGALMVALTGATADGPVVTVAVPPLLSLHADAKMATNAATSVNPIAGVFMDPPV